MSAWKNPTRVSFISCVRDWSCYAECRRSVENLDPHGFEVEIKPVDNQVERYSSPEALNRGWEQSEGELVVCCHEDVTFPKDWLGHLRQTLTILNREHQPWGVVGVVGRAGKSFFGHAEDVNGEAIFLGPLPALVDTVDEFCFVLPRELPVRFDERLGGHHLYAVDLCIQSTEAGFGCYAGDLLCRHSSNTRHRPPEYHQVKKRLQRKWRFRRRRVGRVGGTTCGRIRFGLFEGWV